MTLTFLQHQWKAFWRSKNTGKTVVIKIVMGLLIFYLFVNFILLAFFLDKILETAFPNDSVVRSFNSMILYYFLTDLLMRFQFQELPTLSVRPYLNLPLKRKQIVNYLSLTSLWSGFNFAPLLLCLPFLLKVVLPGEGSGAFFAILVSIIGLTFFNHFFTLWLKKKVDLNSWIMFGFLITVVSIGLLDFQWNLISVSRLSSTVFTAISHNPLFALLLPVLAIGMYVLNFNFLRSNLYLDELHTDKSGNKTSTDIPFLDRFGMSGELAAMELKLIFRNKRPKSTVIRSLLFMLYGLVFYTNPAFKGEWMIVFAGMFMTGIFIINYGQFMFSWQGSHFDGFLAQGINMADFFKSKFILFNIFSVGAFILTIPYVYFGWKYLLIHAAMLLWNLGVNTLLVLFFANRNYKKIDLSKTGSFNWEGVGASQWILSLPLIFGPMLVFFPVRFFAGMPAAVGSVAFVGLAFLLTRSFWIGKLIQDFNEKKYQIAEGFRNE